MPMLFRTVVERKVLNDGHGEPYFKVTRTYLVVAEDAAEAEKMTPLVKGEFVRRVESQDKSPYVYLLAEF